MTNTENIFGRFKEVLKGNYHRACQGLFQGNKYQKVKKLIKPKFNHWIRYTRKVGVHTYSFNSKALRTWLKFQVTSDAAREIKKFGGIDGYLMNEHPRLINCKRAFSYKEQIRQVYAWDRKLDFRKRNERVKEIIIERAKAMEEEELRSKEDEPVAEVAA